MKLVAADDTQAQNLAMSIDQITFLVTEGLSRNAQVGPRSNAGPIGPAHRLYRGGGGEECRFLQPMRLNMTCIRYLHDSPRPVPWCDAAVWTAGNRAHSSGTLTIEVLRSMKKGGIALCRRAFPYSPVVTFLSLSSCKSLVTFTHHGQKPLWLCDSSILPVCLHIHPNHRYLPSLGQSDGHLLRRRDPVTYIDSLYSYLL